MLRVRVGIPKGKRSPRFRAYVDSGSPWCLFKADIGDYLGLDIESGEQDELGGIIAASVELVYFHKLTLFVEDYWTIPIRAGFVRKLSTHGILGRDGFFVVFESNLTNLRNPPLSGWKESKGHSDRIRSSQHTASVTDGLAGPPLAHRRLGRLSDQDRIVRDRNQR
jgi:hypothetical protein